MVFFVFVVLYFTLFCDYYFLEAGSFLMSRKGVDPDGRRGGEEHGGVEGGEIVFRLYCMRKISLFNKREEKIPALT